MDINQICLHCMEVKKENIICPLCNVDDRQMSAEPQALPLRTLLNGKYLVGRLLGSGGFGNTYLAIDLMLRQKVALKEYLPRDFATRAHRETNVIVYSGERTELFKDGLDKFLDEARTLAMFNNHPGIVSIRDFFHANNTGYIVMEYVEGITLKQFLAQKGGRISWQEALDIMTPVMDALREVHSVGMLHRDISPDNIYINRDKQVKLLDFGAARQTLGDMSKSLSVILKPGYAPAEQYTTKGKQGPWTDVYAVAATIYLTVTGVVPDDAMARTQEDNLEPIPVLANVPKPFNNAVMKGLSLQTNNRWQTMAEFQASLTGIRLAVGKMESTDQMYDETKDDRQVEKNIGIQNDKSQLKEQKNAFGKKNVRLLGLFALLALLVTSGIWMFSYFSNDKELVVNNSPKEIVNPKPVLIKDYTNQKLEDARKDLLGRGYTKQRIKVEYVWDKAIKDTVISQQPAVGKSMDKNASVNLKVSQGELKIGDYIQFGKYYDEPILWRVIHKDDEGDPILFSDKIISIKAFDAAGPNHINSNSDRYKSGSNNYEHSNLRQWLNNSYNAVSWNQNSPNKENLENGNNAYGKEKGFLADGNFTTTEREWIKPRTHKVLLTRNEQSQADGGLEPFKYTHDSAYYSVQEMQSNYDTAWYKLITDKVFILSVKELKDYVLDNSSVLGDDFIVGKPTNSAIKKTEYRKQDYEYGFGWSYWVNTPETDSSEFVHYVYDNSLVYIYDAYGDFIGVRPALQLNLSSTIYVNRGTGSSNEPYILKAD